MYVVEFFKRMTRKSNVPVLIYLVLNVIIICAIMVMLFGQSGDIPVFLLILIGLALYAVSLTIALSPLGEWLLRFQTGCKKINRIEYIEYLEPLFNEVYSRAKQMDPSIPDDVELYMNSDASANAFATGRRTICITEGLLEMPPEQIKATLGHEFGHLANKDTDLILIVTVGNLIVTGLIMVIRIVIDIVHFFLGLAALLTGGNEGIIGFLATVISRFLVSVFVSGLMWLWTKIGTALVMKSSRANEFEADEFSFNLGYGDDLCALLDEIGGPAPEGLFATLSSSHPDKHDRISHLQELGSSYRAAIGYQGRSGGQIPSSPQPDQLPRPSYSSQNRRNDGRVPQPQNALRQEMNEEQSNPGKKETAWQPPVRAKSASYSEKGEERTKKPRVNWEQMKSKVQSGASSALKKTSEAIEKAKNTNASKQQQNPFPEPVQQNYFEEEVHVPRHASPSQQTTAEPIHADLSSEYSAAYPRQNASESTTSRKPVSKPSQPAEPAFSTEDYDLESILNEFK